ncbi:putative ABC transporter ATP-binding protein YjkB [Collibacillus ludicampi]|uniref:ABC transporter ATP-binding protein YjkB n=1 Tax=Collibacillus ludicampi TaxID=2771369 RepID=A0AAV4LBD0_9BACL|nr:phosphate ABC transporter ATP-binding protein [Collibacillus ludicampi]GIM45046.1 putative ABC transporter ATP-binding protein YjkB [Collibacillus ludicampi]
MFVKVRVLFKQITAFLLVESKRNGYDEYAGLLDEAKKQDTEPLVEVFPMDACTKPSAALRFEHVSKTIHTKGEAVRVLHDICGEVPHGSILTVIGPSGSGKSTLLSLCNLLLTPDEGRIFVDGKEIRHWATPSLRRHVGMVFQTPTMLPGTVYDNIVIGAKISGKTVERPEEYLEKVGLPGEILHRDAQELSGGQKQRVALVRTLVTQPSILLLDEVTSALDPTSAREVETCICEWNRERGTTVVWITHQLEQARRVGDITWVLVQGQIIEQGETTSLFENPATETTRLFLSGELSGGEGR